MPNLETPFIALYVKELKESTSVILQKYANGRITTSLALEILDHEEDLKKVNTYRYQVDLILGR
jgi:hypothetical protein